MLLRVLQRKQVDQNTIDRGNLNTCISKLIDKIDYKTRITALNIRTNKGQRTIIILSQQFFNILNNKFEISINISINILKLSKVQNVQKHFFF